MGGTTRRLSYKSDLAGRRTKMIWWDNYNVSFDRLTTGDLSAIRANGATTGPGVLARFEYDALGNRKKLTRGNGAITEYQWDPVSRLDTLKHDLPSTTGIDYTKTYAYNPASQIVREAQLNDAFAYMEPDRGGNSFTPNGLNQIVTASGPVSLDYDLNGNLIDDNWTNKSFAYNAENRLTSATSGSNSATFSYDPLMRLDTYNPGNVTRFIYDGVDVAAMVGSTGSLTNRVVRGDGGELIAEYSGTSPIYAFLDERGSTVARSDSGSGVDTILRYDEYGRPAPSNPGWFQYTGQMWLGAIGIYDYKNRNYHPRLGRFLQPDPIGYDGDGPNLYAYVLNDPVNFTDPLGLASDDIVICGNCTVGSGFWGGSYGGSGWTSGGEPREPRIKEPRGGDGGQRGCTAKSAAARARANALASKLGPVTFDSTNEKSLLTQYFQGNTSPYRMSTAEMHQARGYVSTYGIKVLGRSVRRRGDGMTERSVFFGMFPSAAPRLDALLGTATGVFSGGELVGIRDTFNFDFKDRGGYPYGSLANVGVALIRADAASCAGNVSIPVTGGRT